MSNTQVLPLENLQLTINLSKYISIVFCKTIIKSAKAGHSGMEKPGQYEALYTNSSFSISAWVGEIITNLYPYP